MSTDAAPQVYDLLIVTDATGSMHRYLCALRQALPDIIRVSALTGCFSRIGIIAYRDYVPCAVTEWSGWNHIDDDHDDLQSISQAELIRFADRLTTHGNYDWPEACKTGLAHAHSLMRKDATTIMLLFADAPPHLLAVGGDACEAEVAKLSDHKSFDGSGPKFIDWVSAARVLSTGDRKAQVFALIDARDVEAPFLYLTTMTGGNYYRLISPTTHQISDLSMYVLLKWMGFASDNDEHISDFATTATYGMTSGLEMATNEDDAMLRAFMDATAAHLQPIIVSSNICLKQKGSSREPTVVVTQPRSPPMQALEKKYAADAGYRIFAAQQLAAIIESNASAIATHPVYGSLWRAVCADKSNDARAGLVQDFGRAVDRITDPMERQRLTAWLAQSYDYTAAIIETINHLAEEERYPCVLLDPTQSFNIEVGEGSDDRAVTDFSRAELLEIGRSCDPKILRRLGKVLTQLTYVATEADLPAHLRDGPGADVPRIPLALAKTQHKRSFWKLLLHAILPGTQLSTRPAALLAALAIRMGILPLRDTADQELIAFSDKWNDLTATETWNLSCLFLLLDADRDFEARVSCNTTQRPGPDAFILSDEDRRLFRTLSDYKMLELNLQTTLQARIGWKPDKSKVALGPIVVCKQCKFPRSVTVMGKDGICGVCEGGFECRCKRCQKLDDYEDSVRANVTVDDDEKTSATWVECSMTTCRAQYVVYNHGKLRVRPKCYYCIHAHDAAHGAGAAPTVDCKTCLNRMIWPEEYRPVDFDETIFKCPACVTEMVTIVDYETNVTRMKDENGSHWLLRNDNNALEEPFNGRTLFHTVSNVKDIQALAANVEVLPGAVDKLTIHGKIVQNQDALLSCLQGWVDQRSSESGLCTLCFTDMRKTDLRAACGRRGCDSKICSSCMDGWYGINARGKILNRAALSCPFCRRQPTPHTAGRYGLVHLGGLRKAVANPSWIYAWCRDCGFAKEFAERVCAEGAPADIQNWRCPECEILHHEALGRNAPLRMRQCPGCTTMTEKMSGCDHIECPNCQSHWCFQCGENVGAKGIYEHMSVEHGGWWDGWRHGEGNYDYDNE
ncbi:hypothetical protein ACHAQH_004330 [Verticillium albo-atrum]